jgi:hypothetical protein
LLDFSEREPHLVDLAVIIARLNLGALVKGDAEVVLDGGKLFVGHFDGASTEDVHFVNLD